MNLDKVSPELKAMRKRNGSRATDSGHEAEFNRISAAFNRKMGMTHLEIQKIIIADQSCEIAVAWRKWLREKSTGYCVDCHGYHLPTKEHPVCRLCHYNTLHAPRPKDIFFNYRGWKFTPPLICMGCGIEVCFHQWAFSRSCGPCDLSQSTTRRVLYGQCFSGPREKLPTWGEHRGDIPDAYFIDPKDREKYPVMNPERKRLKPPFPRKPLRQISPTLGL